ncbi:MAG: aminotransferase class I/II-fold pyridoxal phosphate-dependent enzyme [Leucobacter sp.]
MLIDDLAPVAYTDELVSAITVRIRDGRLQPGVQLPSIRALATAVGLSPGSVASAMRTLGARGLIVSTQGRRSVVADLARLPVSYLATVPTGLVDLSSVEPDPGLLPDIRGYLNADLYSASMYDATNVIPELERVVREGFDADGISGELTATNGALDALERILSARLHPGDVVLVEDPCWGSQRTLLQVLGLEAVGVAIDDEGFVPEALSQRLTQRRVAAIIHTPRGQNPTGSALSAERETALRRVLSRYPDVLVVEDDHLSGVASVPFRTLTMGRAAWAVVRSFSKTLGPDLRLAVAAMDQETTGRVQMRQLIGPGWVSHLTQRLAARVLSDPVAKDRIERAAASYDERRDLLIEVLAKSGIHARGVCGFTVCVPVPAEAEIVAALARKGWAVQAGEPYRLESRPFIRVCISPLTASGVLEFANVLAGVLLVPRRALRR